MKSFMIMAFALSTTSLLASEYSTELVTSSAISQYSSNQLTARMTLAPLVKKNFHALAKQKCQSLGGSVISSTIEDTDLAEVGTSFTYVARGKVTCDLPEEGLCATQYNLPATDALKICTSFQNAVEREVSAQCLANALVFEEYRSVYFGESRTLALSYCIKATKAGKGEEFSKKVMYQGSLQSHFENL